ncbi:SGNH/GDSL hydrolase family protein [Roseiconus nitratireducens]|uniref:SGNH/GDSL hydrolase family protein n=1 Tax=Roseiconus nitratireducens TaxID=2605748 RepID=A0A5M6D6H3_9BACT|nr:SGNH/GDSL hydrolase family protein [Roseiconus nitratireducens]KAA5543091.1 SGNH/GDSL hydrolase family protein [Roseiconus nitratireducens]
MRRVPHFLLLFGLLLSTAFADDPVIEVGPAELDAGDTIVFLGDSITHQRLYTQYIEDFFITRFPNVPLHFHNAGIGGDKAWDALERLERDVLSKDPELVTILLGMNDGRYQAFDHEIFSTYQTDMNTLLDRLQESPAAVAPITPTMFDAHAARAMLKKRPRDESTLQQYNAVLAYFGTWLRGEADRRGMRSIDMFSPLNQLTRQARLEDPEFTFIQDAIHPGAAGQLIMAHAWLENLGMQGGVSNIVIVQTPKGDRKARAAGGKVSDLVSDDQRIEFTFHAESLPWVTPPETEVAAKMLKLDHRFSREGLQVHGLPQGKYKLSIDDVEVTTFSNAQLASHVELQRYPSTPQSVQAAKVVAMNKQRNESTIRQLRDHWYTPRNLARLRRSVEEATDPPTEEKLAAKYEADQKKMEGFEERLVELEKQADDELAEIYQAAQPIPHRYVIERVQ